MPEITEEKTEEGPQTEVSISEEKKEEEVVEEKRQSETLDAVPEERREERPPFEKPQVLLEWSAPSRPFHPKNITYFLALGVITFALFLLLLYLKETILALVVVSAGFVIFSLNRFVPPQTQYQILNTGVRIADRYFAWGELRFFWWEEKAENLLLNFETFRAYPGTLTLMFPKENQDETEKILLQNLPYREGRRADYLATLDGQLNSLGPRISLFLSRISQGISSLFRR